VTTEKISHNPAQGDGRWQVLPLEGVCISALPKVPENTGNDSGFDLVFHAFQKLMTPQTANLRIGEILPGTQKTPA
jgi:hypothetical protein